MRILLVSQYFYPENFRINDLAVQLKERGHDVTILTGIPNYPQGRFYDGYTMFLHRYEIWNGMEIHRVPIFPRYQGALRLSLNYLSFVLFGCYKARVMKKKNFDVIYAFGTSPITQALPAITMKKRIHVPVILHVQDLWPDNVLVLTGIKNKAIIRRLNQLVDSIYNSCDMILGTSHSFVRDIKSRKGLLNPKKVAFWPQYSVVSKDTKGNRKDLFDATKFNIVFTGNVGEGQGLSMVVKAATQCKNTNIRWHIIGTGRDQKRLEKEVVENGVEQLVFFHGSFPEKEIPGILNSADCALLILRPDPIFEKTIPAKFQTYLACGCPVLGCIEGEARQIITEEQLGICTEEISGKALAVAAKRMAATDSESLAEYRNKALAYSHREFDRDLLLAQLESYMDRLIGKETQ